MNRREIIRELDILSRRELELRKDIEELVGESKEAAKRALIEISQRANNLRMKLSEGGSKGGQVILG